MILSDLQGRGTIHGIVRTGGGGGVTDYDDLTNRPSINNHVVTGSKTGHDYDLANLEDVLIKELNPNITPGVNYPRLEHIKDKDDQIYIVKYPAFTGGISGLVPQVISPSGKVLSDSGNWINVQREKTLIYQLTTGATWETFARPDNINIFSLECRGGSGIFLNVDFDADFLPSRTHGDNYVTIGTIPHAQGQNINLATNDDKDIIYISTSGVYDTNNIYVRIKA